MFLFFVFLAYYEACIPIFLSSSSISASSFPRPCRHSTFVDVFFVLCHEILLRYLFIVFLCTFGCSLSFSPSLSFSFLWRLAKDDCRWKQGPRSLFLNCGVEPHLCTCRTERQQCVYLFLISIYNSLFSNGQHN